jgi:pilus assembly protein CpaF
MALPEELSRLFLSGVTDVLITGVTDARVDRGLGLEPVEFAIKDPDLLRKFAIELALEHGARVDIAKPIADFSVDNYRLQVVLPFGVSDHTLISVRRHPKTQVTLEHLAEVQLFSSEQLEFLCTQVSNKQSILITGPTGSGKTTLLSALIHQTGGRVVCIEETPELVAPSPAVLLTERPHNQEGVGGVSASELLRHSLRMRPDWIALGEVRGAEFGNFLLAINNGHSALATLHSRATSTVGRRLLVLGKLAGFTPELTQNLCLDAIDLVIQLTVHPQGRRAEFARLTSRDSHLMAVPLEI